MDLIPGSGRSPGEGLGNPLQNSCLENPMDRRSWWAIVHSVSKEVDMTEATKHTRLDSRGNSLVVQWLGLCTLTAEGPYLILSDFTFTFHFHSLEKEMAAHSSSLTWKIPWTEEPGRLQSMGSQSWTRLTDFTLRLNIIQRGFPGSTNGKEPTSQCR